MLKLIKELFSVLTPSQRRQFYTLQVLVIIMALTEVVGVISIIPFMALVGDMTLLQQDTIIAQVYQFSGIVAKTQFVFLLGIVVLVMLFTSATISIFTTWRLSMFATKVGTEIADKLYTHYLKQDWLFHVSGSSARLTKKIANETTRITQQVLFPLMQMNARIMLVFFISVAIIAYDLKVAIVGLLIFAVAYLILYKVVRKRLDRNGQAISSVYEQRFRLMNEGFGGIKDILLLGRDDDFIQRFNKTGHILAYSQGINGALAYVPRYFIELIAFGSMIALVLYLIATQDGNLGMVLPILFVYALSGFKLLPALQQIYFNIAQIKGNISAFESIQQDLSNSGKQNTLNIKVEQKSLANLYPQKNITLENITFTYPNKEEPTINNLTISIKANSIVGIVGASGSGKSTLIDVLLGLITPQQGNLLIDGAVVEENNKRAWQNTIGFVPQSIYLSEGTIAENVAFGIPEKAINLDQVNKALNLSHLDELVQVLEKGIHTKVGERGVQLSGGQRQRIGIARALYHEANILVFDEATSALDGVTEKIIMDAIRDFCGQKTIILIAHRLKTVQKCDTIFMIDQGQVSAQGTFEELLKTNEHFKRMASHA
jgi:ATP-binding cassette, subfamily B, bacterial PglK